MSSYNKETISEMSQATGEDIQSLLQQYVSFNENQKQDIIDYYSGNISRPIADSFNRLSDLQISFDKSLSAISQNKRALERNDFWSLTMEIESIKTTLQNISNSSKLLRSAITKNDFNPDPLISITLKQGQTLESLSSQLNSESPNNDWTDIARTNRISEEDYTSDSGNLLKVNFQGADSIFISSVIDNIDSAEKTYGIDIASRFEFVDNDLKVLTYKETLIQTLEILTTLAKGNNPQYPNDGIQRNLAIGSTIGSLSFPALFRQLYSLFDKDDSFRSFSITDVDINGDLLELNYEVRTKAGEVQQGSFSL